MGTSGLCALLLFSLLLLRDVGGVKASRRLYTNDWSYRASHNFKLRTTLMDGVVSNNSESPPLKDSKSPPPLKESKSPPPPSPSVAETVRLVFTAGNLSRPPSKQAPIEFGGSSSGLSRAVVIVLLSFALFGVIALAIWFICFKGRRHERAEYVRNSRRRDDTTMENGHRVSPRPPVPAQPSAAPTVNGQGSGRPVRTHSSAPPPKANVPGEDGSVPAKPSAAPLVNGRGDGGSVPTPPTPERPNERRDVLHKASSHPAPMKTAPSASIQLASRHNSLPSRVAEFGLTSFTYEELRDATDNFSEANFLGEGGFAKVYKGSLSRNRNRKVAVKVLKNENSKAEKEFRNEVDIISRVRHVNIVTLIGYCITDSKRLIVYEFVENKSLHDHLRGGKNLQFMDWAIRMKIAQGAAKGLAYLHDECGHQNIIHRDVKPANILLDSSFVAKVADFGISKLCPKSFESYIAPYIIGSPGFIDPFYYETKELSFKSDVYSFGVVLLMLISGETHLPTVQELKNRLHKVLKHRKFDTIADSKLEKNYNLDEMTLMVNCVEACLRKDPKDRPQMIQVARVLEKVISADELKLRTRPKRGV